MRRVLDITVKRVVVSERELIEVPIEYVDSLRETPTIVDEIASNTFQ